MGKVYIQECTTKTPLSLMGYNAGVCYNSDISNIQKNIKRGINCLTSGHTRVAEFPKIYLVLDGYSAKVIREWYTHIIDVTRLQSSTRYIKYDNFEYITPPRIKKNPKAAAAYEEAMTAVKNAIQTIKEENIPQEDYSGLLPLNYATKITCSIGLRSLIAMSNQRLCLRAYWEYRQLMEDLLDALESYSEEWELLFQQGVFVPKCKMLGYCPEKNSCGLTPKRRAEIEDSSKQEYVLHSIECLANDKHYLTVAKAQNVNDPIIKWIGFVQGESIGCPELEADLKKYGKEQFRSSFLAKGMSEEQIRSIVNNLTSTLGEDKFYNPKEAAGE